MADSSTQPHQTQITDCVIKSDYLSNMTLNGSNEQNNLKKMEIFNKSKTHKSKEIKTLEQHSLYKSQTSIGQKSKHKDTLDRIQDCK